MTELHCTLRLAKRLPFPIVESEVSCTNRLGPWCANVFSLGRTPMIMLTNERTLLSAVIPFKTVQTFWERFLDSLEIQLHSIALPSRVIHAELVEMREVAFSRKTNRQVLGSMNDFVIGAKFYAEAHQRYSLDDISFALNLTPCGPLKFASPQEAALEVFSGHQ